MSFDLSRVDYTLIGLASLRCMKLLPNGTFKTAQKVVTGGADGVLQVISLKSREVHLTFKTLPGERIAALELAGTNGSALDRIFISVRNEVRGYTKKGKLFLGFDTNLTEAITSMYVAGSDLLVSGTHVFNHYADCKDSGSYLCCDKINHITAVTVDRGMHPVLACDDLTIRTLGASCNNVKSAKLASKPTTLSLYNNDGGEKGNLFVYGMQNGEIGQMKVTGAGIQPGWLITNDKKREAVNCMHWYDMSRDGCQELLVGREDGSIQIYAQPFEPLSNSEPLVEKFNYVCNESVLSIQGGCVGNPLFDEIVCSSYTGWLFGLTTEILDKGISNNDDSQGQLALNITGQERSMLEQLKLEINSLEQSIAKEREKYQMTTGEGSVGFSTLPFINVSHKLSFLKNECLYQLSIETEKAIDNVLVQCDVDLKLMDVEKNSAVVSHSTCVLNRKNKLLATYRCQVNTTKLTTLLECGAESGTLNAYITPNAQPKVAERRAFFIKPLSSYSRAHLTDQDRAYNLLILSGPFSFAEIHNWVSLCLPDVPEKLPAGDTVQFTYHASYTDTILDCSYGKGEATVKSDDLTAVLVIKDIISREATRKKIKLSMHLDMNEDSVKHQVSKLYEKLKKQLEIKKQFQLLTALNDIQVEAEWESQLTERCRQVVDSKLQIEKQITSSGAQLSKLEGMLTNVFVHWTRLKNINIKNKMERFYLILHEGSLEDLLDFIMAPNEPTDSLNSKPNYLLP